MTKNSNKIKVFVDYEEVLKCLEGSFVYRKLSELSKNNDIHITTIVPYSNYRCNKIEKICKELKCDVISKKEYNRINKNIPKNSVILDKDIKVLKNSKCFIKILYTSNPEIDFINITNDDIYIVDNMDELYDIIDHIVNLC